MKNLKHGTHVIAFHLSITEIYLWLKNFQICVTRSLVLCVCFVDRRLFFCLFSFDHCVVYPALTYDFWLPPWYIQTLLIAFHLILVLFYILALEWNILIIRHIVRWYQMDHVIKRLLWLHSSQLRLIPYLHHTSSVLRYIAPIGTTFGNLQWRRY